jgi:hypothetical protein
MSKCAGHPCPKCNALPCAEFTMKDEAPRWSCSSCGASGWLAAAAKPAPVPRVHKNPGRLS